MQALVINIGHATDRMDFMASQLNALGLLFERIEAITPDSLAPDPSDPVWHRWQRPLRMTEMALCASHMLAWRRIIALGRPCLVLEDDAMLSVELLRFLERVAPLCGADHISLEVRGRRKLVARQTHPAAPMRRLYQDRTGAAAMVVWPAGAKKLLAAAQSHPALADALISGRRSLVSYQADPALSIQLDQCGSYGLPLAIPTASLIDAEAKPPLSDLPWGDRIAFRRRRILAQIGIGLRIALCAPVAKRVSIAPRGAWVKIPRASVP